MNTTYQRISDIADELSALYNLDNAAPRWIEELITARFPSVRGAEPMTREAYEEACRRANEAESELGDISCDLSDAEKENIELNAENDRLRARIAKLEDRS